MTKLDIILPAMGEGVIEATITKLFVKQGDKVKEDDVIIEIATDKVDSEITAPQDGIIGDILYNEDDIVKVGETILYLSDETEDKPIKKEQKIETQIENVRAATQKNIVVEKIHSIELNQNTNADNFSNKTKSGKFISPLVRNIAKQEKISLSELDTINGTGEHQRITKRDIVKYLKNKTEDSKIETKSITEKPITIEAPKQEEQNSQHEIIKMDRIRKLIANHMINSIKTSAHVSSFVEVDMTNIVTWREKVKASFLKNEGENLTYTPIFIEVVAKALKDFPMINVSIDGDNIIKKRNINVGMATALPDGNLIVPVIKNADKLSLTGLAKTVNDLAKRGRENNLLPEEIQEGTFTITNFGTFNNIFGTPIINQPQVAILGIGAIKKQVAVIETKTGDTIGIRNKMILSLSYDHRVVDGALGGMFVAKIGEYLENYNPQVYNL